MKSFPNSQILLPILLTWAEEKGNMSAALLFAEIYLFLSHNPFLFLHCKHFIVSWFCRELSLFTSIDSFFSWGSPTLNTISICMWRSYQNWFSFCILQGNWMSVINLGTIINVFKGFYRKIWVRNSQVAAKGQFCLHWKLCTSNIEMVKSS